ncbi:hypothetical protein [Sphingomonas sp. 28-63-12]|uniref:hypothetical protein n=1 Tax=Sphingomonas sp. 28-63-12 TaxID=1970434 RepID=UPI000BC58FFE|nr:MAG: hypothetical protein B7Y47_04735 [Sphingomonas sp. 28-63-12]
MRRDVNTNAKHDRWLNRAVAILEGRANGMGMPVLRALTRRGHHAAMAELANRLTSPENSEYDLQRGLELERRLARAVPESWIFGNLSTTLRNHGDMAGYRRWLALAARTGDLDYIAEMGRFETRFPFPIMKRWGRYRPFRRSER